MSYSLPTPRILRLIISSFVEVLGLKRVKIVIIIIVIITGMLRFISAIIFLYCAIFIELLRFAYVISKAVISIDKAFVFQARSMALVSCNSFSFVYFVIIIPKVSSLFIWALSGPSIFSIIRSTKSLSTQPGLLVVGLFKCNS